VRLKHSDGFRSKAEDVEAGESALQMGRMVE
jgi:hypothetical protein